MATITGLTAERMLEIEAASVVDGDIVGNDLILARQDGSIINAGNVRGPAGPTGPMGSALSVISGIQVADVGQVAQVRAGRQLTPADFTNMGLSAPLGLWNLSNFNDSSGNNRHLTNKGSVPLGVGINGLASTAVQFAGVQAQALYISDPGTSPFRIRVGTVGCWQRTPKRGTHQYLVTKVSNAGSASVWTCAVRVDSTNKAAADIGDGVALSTTVGVTDIADDRWHFVVFSHDGTNLRLYVDGACESAAAAPKLMQLNTAPLNIGSYGTDVAATAPPVAAHFGRISNAFVTDEILTEEQIRNLYCASIPHALGSVPSGVSMSVQRKRRGAALATTDFPSQPARLYNFTGGALTDQGSSGLTLAPGGGGTIVDVAGPDGLPNGAKSFSGAHTGLTSADTGLPSGTQSRSYGIWFKSLAAVNGGMIGWGTDGSADAKIVLLSTGLVRSDSGADSFSSQNSYNDGRWHHAVAVEDNAAADGVRRKLYINGVLVGGTTVMNPITVTGGAARFRIGANPSSGANPFGTGQLSRGFVYAGALTADDVRALYNKGSQALAASPKAAEDHIEAMESGRLLGVFDSIEGSDLIDLAVMS